MPNPLPQRSVLLIDAICCIIMLLGLMAVSQRAGDDALIDSLAQSMETGTVSINGTPALDAENAEFLFNGYAVGSVVDIGIGTPGANGMVRDERHEQHFLGRHYTVGFVLINAAVSLLFMFLAVFVFLKAQHERGARTFHHLCVTIAVLICVNPGYRGAFPEIVGIPLRLAFCFGYALVPLWMLQFSLNFPRIRPGSTSLAVRAIWSLAFVVATFMAIGIELSLKHANTDFFIFDQAFKACRYLFLACVGLSVVFLVKSYAESEQSSDRRKILWVLLGYVISVLSFSLLWVLPQVLFHQGWIAQEWIIILVAVAPITFTIAIVRYRLLDIDFIVNRGVVYVLVIALLLGIYAALMTLAVSVYGRDFYTLQWILPGIIILNILLFAPARGFVQRFVDRTFFRVQYNYRNTQREVLEHLRQCLSSEQLAAMVVQEVQQLMKARRCVVAQRTSDHSLQVLAADDFDQRSLSAAELYDTRLFSASYSMLADGADTGAVLCVGPKKSGQRYSDEDIDLLVSISAQCGAMMHRFALQEDLLREHMESQRLTELNELKSYFVSGVTHELKTPLTSIKMFAEMLQSHVGGEKALNYLRIIEGESDRLTRLINNVLDYAKIERGVKEYHPENVEVKEAVEAVQHLLEYQLQLGGFHFECTLNVDGIVLRMDRDAFIEVLINLLSNAMKYSGEVRDIRLVCSATPQEVVVSVVDQGIGIQPEDLARMFDPFVRLGAAGSNRVGGAGLGLALVKHFCDAHHARIEVQSRPGDGTAFHLHFPRG